jgi:hypothetical protein
MAVATAGHTHTVERRKLIMATIYMLAKVVDALDAGKQALIEQKLSLEFPSKWRAVGNGVYLVSADSSLVTEDISDKTGISDGSAGEYIVTAVHPYFGWASTSVWEWINANG